MHKAAGPPFLELRTDAEAMTHGGTQAHEGPTPAEHEEPTGGTGAVADAATAGDGRVADALPGHWSERWLPASWRPYARLMRLERPVGWWLLLLPGWWAVVLAQVAAGGGLPDLKVMALFLVGAIVMRGAGCVYNDIVDRDIDAKVARTRSRPLPSGQVSVRQAWAFLIVLALIGLVVLLQLNATAIGLGVASLGLVLIYPHMKRYTYWPQVFLGLAFNWGAVLGWAAVRGTVEAPALALYGAGILWTLAYDTIYAHQDREDDLIAGVKSTALKLGDRTPAWLAGFFGGMTALLALAGWLAGAGWPWYLGVAAAAAHALWQLARLDIHDAQRCLQLFRANRDLGLMVLAGGLLDLALKALGLA